MHIFIIFICNRLPYFKEYPQAFKWLCVSQTFVKGIIWLQITWRAKLLQTTGDLEPTPVAAPINNDKTPFTRKRNEIAVSCISKFFHGCNLTMFFTRSWSAVFCAHFYATGNNVNLLAPQGQFGTRMAGGKDHAAPRYIFTRREISIRLGVGDLFMKTSLQLRKVQNEKPMMILQSSRMVGWSKCRWLFAIFMFIVCFFLGFLAKTGGWWHFLN